MDQITSNTGTILLIGGNGYLGGQLLEYFEQSNESVVIADKFGKGSGNEFVVDITKSEEVRRLFEEVRPSIVLHLAADLNRDRTFANYKQTHNVNYWGTLNILNAIRNYPCKRLVFTSTSEIYGQNTPPYTETMVPRPISPYSLTKTMAETAIQTYSELFDIDFTILRLFNFYGKNMPKQFFIPELLSCLQAGKEFKMTGGEQARDFLHVKDVIQAIVLAVNSEKANQQIFNVCSGNSIALKNLVLDFKDLLNSSTDIDFGAIPYRANEIWDMSGDNSKICKVLGFEVKHSFSDLFYEKSTPHTYE